MRVCFFLVVSKVRDSAARKLNRGRNRKLRGRGEGRRPGQGLNTPGTRDFSRLRRGGLSAASRHVFGQKLKTRAAKLFAPVTIKPP